MMSQHTGNGLLHSLNGDGLALLGSYTADIQLTTMAKGHTVRTLAAMMTLSCSTNKPLQLKVVKALKEVLVINLYATLLKAFVANPHVLVVVLYLISMGIQSAVRSDDAVAVEVIVAGGIAAVVATIGKDFLACDRTLIAQTLIYEVPDKATLILRIFADDIPILLEATHRVTHSMSILTLDERTRVIRLGIVLAVAIAHIHRTEDVRLAPLARLLVLYRTIIYTLNPVVALLKVRTVASLVTKTPDDDTRMVAQGEHISLVALQMHLLKVSTLGQRTFSITHTVTLQIGLCHEVQTS